MANFPKLFIPGPTHVSDEILEAFSTPQIGHRTPEISELISQLILDIQKVLYTKNHIYLVSHPATGLWEMAIRNSVKKRVLHCVNGAFSKKWAQVSKEVGVEPYVLRFWETKFSQLRPVKRSGGRRFYRPSDIDKLKVIKSLLYDNGLTIKGAVEQLKKINTNEDLTNKEIIIQTNDGKDSLDIKQLIINELIEIRSSL